MPGFYRRPKLDTAISQGDVFDGVPLIGVTIDLLRAIPDGAGFRAERIEPDKLSDEMILFEQVGLTRAIVISQSCDAERAPQLMLAPVTPFELNEKTVDKKWKKISQAATSLSETKYVYLPGNPHLGLARSRANFGEAFTVPRSLLEELARRGKRIGGLGEKAVAYFQFRLAVMLTRVAQDDYAWPSGEDIGIKIAYLQEEIKDRTKKAEKLTIRIQNASAEIQDELAAEYQELKDELGMLDRQIKVAEAARPHADELAEESSV